MLDCLLDLLLVLGHQLLLKQAGGGFPELTRDQLDLKVIKYLMLGASAHFGGAMIVLREPDKRLAGLR